MSTINYRISEYITLGVKPYDRFNEKIRQEVDEYEDDAYIEDCYNEDYANIKEELEKYDFWYFNIGIKDGYYEGFTLDIERNFPVAYDTWEDKRDAQKEITKIRQLLIACASHGLVSCYPGSFTGYSDREETLAAIDQAIREMREDVRATPTWAQYERSCEVA